MGFEKYGFKTTQSPKSLALNESVDRPEIPGKKKSHKKKSKSYTGGQMETKMKEARWTMAMLVCYSVCWSFQHFGPDKNNKTNISQI